MEFQINGYLIFDKLDDAMEIMRRKYDDEGYLYYKMSFTHKDGQRIQIRAQPDGRYNMYHLINLSDFVQNLLLFNGTFDDTYAVLRRLIA